MDDLFSRSPKISFGMYVGRSIDLPRLSFLNDLFDLFSCKQLFRSIIGHIITTARSAQRFKEIGIKKFCIIYYLKIKRGTKEPLPPHLLLPLRQLFDCVGFVMFEVIFIEYGDILKTGINNGDKNLVLSSITSNQLRTLSP